MRRYSSFSDYVFFIFLLVAGSFLCVLLILGCGGHSPPSIPVPVVTIKPPADTTVDPSNTSSLSAAVTNDETSEGVTWSVSCPASACGTLSNSTTTSVTYTAPTTAAAALTITIKATSIANPAAYATTNLSVPASPAITLANLPSASIAKPYAANLTATGGIPPYSWLVVSGNLPPGLSLNPSTGDITGIPTSAGNYAFTAAISDSGSPILTATGNFTLSVTAPTITFSTTALSNADAGSAYTAKVAATGGAGTLTYSIAKGSLPSGLTLSSAGIISGIPTTAGTSSITLKATDAYGDTGSSSALTLVVDPALAIDSSTLPNATAQIAYTASLSATGGSGTGYTWQVLSGSGLSAVGLTLTNTGIIAGTPSNGEVATPFTVQVTDSGGYSATATVTLTVNYAHLTITTTSLPNGVIGDPYSSTLNASDAVAATYTWAALSPLPSGLSLSSSGIITGTPTTVGTTNITFSVTSSIGKTVTANIPLTVNVPLAISSTSLATGTQGTNYEYTLTATGGTGTGNIWTVTGGTALSAVGLTLSSNGTIHGIPTAGESSAPFTVQVTDSNGDTATASLDLSVTAVVFQGQVLSGTQPIAGASIRIYAVGSAGNGSASTPMLTQSVTTDDAGYFVISGLYICGQSGTGTTIQGSNQIYLVATGGTVGSNQSANNSISLMTAVGNCSNLTAANNTVINELTTVASVWALAPFAASATAVGATSTNTMGIDNAFLDAALLANPATGTTAALPTNLTVEGAKLNALADVLASCVDSDGGADCETLFTAATPANGATPADTLTAALNIVKNPGQNVASVYGAMSTAPPYTTSLTEAPNDWTMSLTVTGGGLIEPTALDIDASGNVWVADYPGFLSAFTAQGTPLSGSPYGNGILNNSFGLTIDTLGNIWVSNEEYPNHGDGTRGAVSLFRGANSSTPGAWQFYIDNDTVDTPIGLAADTNGDVLIANATSSMASIYFSTPTLVATNLGHSESSFPEAITADASHGLWLANEGDGSATHVAINGTILSHTVCCAGADAIVMDVNGNVWVSDPYSGAIAEISPTGTLLQFSSAGGLSSPSGLAIDAAQNIWATNISGNTISELSGSLSNTPGSGLSFASGYGRDANLLNPHNLIPDSSGNLWITNYSDNNLVMIFGLSTPTTTPAGPIALAP